MMTRSTFSTAGAVAVAVLSLTGLSSGKTLPRNTTGGGFLSLPLSRVNRNTTTLSTRQTQTGLDNPEYGTIYIVDITIGTPPQPISVQIDTGSSDLWVDPDCATSGQTAFCQSYPQYDPFTSSTALDTGEEMDLAYGKGSCSGEYLLDSVVVGGDVLVQQQFGYAESSTDLPTGIMGIGPGVELIGYYNVIDQLYLQGFTQSRAFSLNLGNVDTAEGSIIFGGVDTMKYSGPLEKRPIIPPDESPDGDRYWIYMTSVGITKPGASSKIYTTPTYNQAVFLDSGGTLSRLPANLVEAMVADFPGAVSQGNGLYTVDCAYTGEAGTLDFGFGNTVIHVPFLEFIWQSGPDTCNFGAVANAATDYDWVLGDTFLRSAYVVYDVDNENLLLANAADCGSNEVAISSGPDSVPSITGACALPVVSGTTPSSSMPLTTTSSTSKSTTKSTTTTSSKKSTTTTSSTKSTSTKSNSSTKSSSTKSSSTKSSSTKSSSTKSSTKSTSTTKMSTTSSKSSTSTKSSTFATTTKSTSSSTSKTSTSAHATPTGTLGYAYLGCYSTSSQKWTKRILSNTSMTVELCLEYAQAANPPYPYAGVEFGRECWAGTTIPATVTPTSGPSACTMTCDGNSKEYCGGPGQANYYRSTPVPTGVLGYNYLGCYETSGQAWVKRILSNTSMTVELCLEFAKNATPPYPYAGVEFGKECWAGTTIPATVTATSGPSACTMTCDGNSKESCGGPGHVNYYHTA